jgi:glyoxylase-like metal-dependent hydrolase (beta-lactamase superfamily II)
MATVIALDDGQGPFFEPRARAFPTATADQWRAADARDPAAITGDGDWLLRFRCFAVRLDAGPTVVVDAGIGPADAPAASWAPTPGRLPDSLHEAGIAPDEVDAVVLTHLHTDHIGWAAGALFPNARHVVQRADVDALGGPLSEVLIDPLRAADRLQLVDGDVTLLPSLQLRHTPGHTPGHQVALLRTPDETLALTGDLLLHAAQLVDPAVTYLLDGDPEAARASRLVLLDELRGGPAMLATAHPTEPFHPVPGSR